jgi:DNA-binding MarR family transcriptional regulator
MDKADNVKESFRRVKEDIDSLRYEIGEVRKSLIELCGVVEKIAREDRGKHEKIDDKTFNLSENNPAHVPAQVQDIPTIQHINPAHNFPFKPLTPQNQAFSTGNRGVPADRQTNQQTDRQVENSIENAAEMLKSLDNIKKDIRQKFKHLTEQEWLVFSTIYQLDSEAGYSDYKIISERLKLTESSIRDYVARLIKKGIPVDKTRLNNKNIRLNVSPSLKQIASLSAILSLRDL